MSKPDATRWWPTPALSTAVGAMALLLLLSVALGRVDLLVIALPISVGTILALRSRSFELPTVRRTLANTQLLEGETTALLTELQAGGQLDLIRSRTRLSGWLQFPDGDGQFCTSVRPGETAVIRSRLISQRWGRAELQLVELVAYTAHGLLRAQRPGGQPLRVNSLPLRAGFTATDLVPGAAGIVGAHRSRRLGEGIDPAGVRPFVAGDRLRRINWPVSSRTGELHVTATYSDRDTEVVLVLDTSVEIGLSAGVTGTASNLDIAVRAAGAVAEHYLRHGDRVGLLNLARPGRPIRSRAGRAQLIHVLDTLLDVLPAPITDLVLTRALARISDRALVIVLSPLLNSAVAVAVAGLARAGRAVLLVDTLPEQVILPEDGEWTELAWRIQLLHRQNLVGSLSEHGVPVVGWRGAGSLDQVLAGLSRLAGAPKVRR